MLSYSNPILDTLTDYFILEKTQKKSENDFFWVFKTDDKIIIALIDRMPQQESVELSNSTLEFILNDIALKTKKITSDYIIRHFHKELLSLIQQKNIPQQVIEMGVCCIDLEELALQFSGAMCPLLVIQNPRSFTHPDSSVYKEIKPDKILVGDKNTTTLNCNKKEIDISVPTIIYIFSDGYQDQLGGKQSRKFSRKRLKNMLLSIHHLPMSDQKKIIDDSFFEWKGKKEQMDDVLIIGAKIEY